jgi:hypothetical protein
MILFKKTILPQRKVKVYSLFIIPISANPNQPEDAVWHIEELKRRII